MKNPKVFVSYSWDSVEHQEWVLSLVNELRRNGIQANADAFITQTNTVNLNHMMVDNIKHSDFTIIICTNKYTQKADEVKGGVGFETNMLMSILQKDMQKIVVILKDKSKDAIPFYLNGVNYIDFSDDDKFKDNFKELLHRLLNVPLLELEPIGNLPNLETRKIKNLMQNNAYKLEDSLIPNFKKYSDIDKRNFLNESFKDIKQGLIAYLNKTKQQNNNFEYICDEITAKKYMFNLYLDGNHTHSLKIWIGSGLGFASAETINFSQGKFVTENDTSMNEIIGCDVRDNSLVLKMQMNMYGEKADNSIDVINTLWKSILPYIR